MQNDSVMDIVRNLVVLILFLILVTALSLFLSAIVITLIYQPQYILDDPFNVILSSVPVDVALFYGVQWLEYYKAYGDIFIIDRAPGYAFFTYKYVGSIIVPYILIMSYVFLRRKTLYEKRPFKAQESQHGDARWATQKDITKAGLRAKKGMLLGVDDRGYLVAGGFQHTLLFAPTGSGKGVGFVIPNLLFWEDSVVVHDIKLENYELTSGWRKSVGHDVYVWNPANPDGVTHCYNPIDWVSSKPGQMVDDVQKIANLILPKKEFWENEARSLFVGVVLYLIADAKKVNSFGEVVRTLRSDDVVYHLATALDTLGEVMHPVGYMNIAAFLQKADKERSGVVSTLNSGLELWANPLIDTATATSDFNVMDFKKKLTTVYVGLTPDNLKRLQPLMQVFYQQSTEFLSRKMPGADEPHGVMFLMDEFPTLGKMEQFMSGIAYFRGYHVRLFLIIQDTQQLKGIYEDSGMNSFLSNSTYRVTFAANNVETAELISKLCGNKTIEQVSGSRPKYLDFNPGSRSLNVSKGQRALLLPQEVIGLPRDDQILLIESSPPIRSKKIKYYADNFFKKRLLKQTEVPVQEPYDPRKNAQDSESEVVEENTQSNDDQAEAASSYEGAEGQQDRQEQEPLAITDTVEENSDFSEDENNNIEDEERGDVNNEAEGATLEGDVEGDEIQDEKEGKESIADDDEDDDEEIIYPDDEDDDEEIIYPDDEDDEEEKKEVKKTRSKTKNKKKATKVKQSKKVKKIRQDLSEEDKGKKKKSRAKQKNKVSKTKKNKTNS